MDLRVLTLTNYGETLSETSRVTLCSHHITVVLSKESELEGRLMRDTSVLFMDGSSIGLRLSEMDLLTLEQAVGTYTLDPSFGF